jgi:hypothetical protein
MCADPDHYKPLDAPVGPEPVAVIPVVQLYAGDVPGLVFPAGTDLLQILWCALVQEDDQYAASLRLHWRSTALTAAAIAGGTASPAYRARRATCLARGLWVVLSWGCRRRMLFSVTWLQQPCSHATWL